MADPKNPTVADVIDEVQGVFASDAALQDAVSRLAMLRFDHADMSLPRVGGGTPEGGAESVTTDTDTRQLRALGGGMIGVVGAMVAGAAIVGTGGAAAPAVAAMAAGGVASAAAMQGGQRAADAARSDDHDKSAERGELILAVRTRHPEDAARAEAAMRDAGATRVAPVRRQGSGAAVASSSGWTG